MQYASLQHDSCLSMQYSASRRSSLRYLLSALWNLITVAGLFFLLLSLAGHTRAADIAYTYDGTGRLTGVVNAEGQSAVYDYDPLSNILAIRSASIDSLNIAGFSPGQGPIGSTVNIAGSGFDVVAANNTVTFNGMQARVNCSEQSSARCA